MEKATRSLRHFGARRASEEREYRLYLLVGFVLFFPVVVMGRISKWRWPGRRIAAAPRSRESIICETMAEVRSALAFVFMA